MIMKEPVQYYPMQTYLQVCGANASDSQVSKDITTTGTLRIRHLLKHGITNTPMAHTFVRSDARHWFYHDNNPKIYNRSVQCILVGYSQFEGLQCWDRKVAMFISYETLFSLSHRIWPSLHPGVAVMKM